MMSGDAARAKIADPRLVQCVASFIERALVGHEGLLVFGICGAQGSGKSTLAAALEQEVFGRGVATARLSLDDLYLQRVDRARLAREVHPLFKTRGVPGTHDVGLGLSLISALRAGQAVPLPRFDKVQNDRMPAREWPVAPAGTRLLLLEGWCVGARPQPAEALDQPVNALERDDDRDGRWRRHANAALAGEYQRLFAELDRLLMLRAPGFDVVARWRHQQEQDIGDEALRMDAAEVRRFVQHSERLTRWMLQTMPDEADMVVPLDQNRVPELGPPLERQHLDEARSSA